MSATVGRLPIRSDGGGPMTITNGQVSPIPGGPGQFLGINLVIDPVNALLTAVQHTPICNWHGTEGIRA